MKVKRGIEHFFAFPLQEIVIEKVNVRIPEQYGFCSIYNPEWQDQSDPLYFAKVFDQFSPHFEDLPDLTQVSLLFGESRFWPIIPVRGKMKWISLYSKHCSRSITDIPDYKESSLRTDIPPEQRIWWLIENGGLTRKPRDKSDYELLRHLEFSTELGEIGVKYRVYIRLIQRALELANEHLSIEYWKEVMFRILRQEESTKKIGDHELRTGLIDNYIYDFLDVWSWDQVPHITARSMTYRTTQ